MRFNVSRNIAAWIITSLIRVLHFTGRWTIQGEDYVRQALGSGHPVILCFWHGRLLMLPPMWKRFERPFHMLISHHRDGLLIAQVIQSFGIHTVHGSTARRGAPAALSLLRLLKNGAVIGITPDGPRGPAQQISDGVITLASLANALIIPVFYDCNRKFCLKTWDKFVIPKLFTKGVVGAGKPIDASVYTDSDSLKDALADAMEDIMRSVMKKM